MYYSNPATYNRYFDMFEPSPSDHQQQIGVSVGLGNGAVGSGTADSVRGGADDSVPLQKLEFPDYNQTFTQYQPSNQFFSLPTTTTGAAASLQPQAAGYLDSTASSFQYHQTPAQQQQQSSQTSSQSQYTAAAAAAASQPDLYNFNNSTMFNTTETALATPSSTTASYTPSLLPQQQPPLSYSGSLPQYSPQQQQQQQQHQQQPMGLSYNTTTAAAAAGSGYDYYDTVKASTQKFNMAPHGGSHGLDYSPFEYKRAIKHEDSDDAYIGKHAAGKSSRAVSKAGIEDDDSDLFYPGGKKRYRVIRGMAAGGCATKPPKEAISSEHFYVPVELELLGAALDECCFPKWSPEEKSDKRRIIRIERTQQGAKLVAKFSIIGAANEHPTTEPAAPDSDVVEVSCLECTIKSQDDEESQESGEDYSPLQSNGGGSGVSSASTAYGYGDYNRSSVRHNSTTEDEFGNRFHYYITSVEVVEIVELLIGTQLKDPAERRKERGRVRSNLVPFWSKKPISSRMIDNSTTHLDFRAELAKRIMAYDIRKPRGFDKEVRILRWDKLVPALKRALQSYYTEIPASDAHLFTN